MMQAENRQRRRRAFAVSLVLLGIAAMLVVPIKLSIHGKAARDAWIKLVGNTSPAANQSAKWAPNESADELLTRLKMGSAHEAENGSAKEPANGSASGSAHGSAKCSGDWQGCLNSRCCVSEGHRCYKKNWQWAQCRSKCTPGIDPLDKHLGKQVLSWSCDDWDLTPSKCAGPWESCLHSKCCKHPKQRCFKKNDHWAQCRDSCSPGPDEHDKKTGKHLGNWSCQKFDDTLLPANCSADETENCWSTRCCANLMSKCFKKDDGWAACNSTCTEAINPRDPPQHQHKWTCDLV